MQDFALGWYGVIELCTSKVKHTGIYIYIAPHQRLRSGRAKSILAADEHMRNSLVPGCETCSVKILLIMLLTRARLNCIFSFAVFCPKVIKFMYFAVYKPC